MMIVTVVQIHKMIRFLNWYVAGVCLSEQGNSDLSDLLNEIMNAQSHSLVKTDEPIDIGV